MRSDEREKDLRARLHWFLTEVMGPLTPAQRTEYLLRVLKDYHAKWDAVPRPPAPPSRATAVEIARTAGADDFLCLPISARELYAAVERLLARPAKAAAERLR